MKLNNNMLSNLSNNVKINKEEEKKDFFQMSEDEIKQHFANKGSAKEMTNEMLVKTTFDLQKKSSGEMSLQFGLLAVQFGGAISSDMSSLDSLQEQLGYTGKPTSEMSQEELQKSLSEDGYFGVKQTSDRIADFVIEGAGDDLQRLKDGKTGVQMGFDDAKEMMGGEVPQISEETMSETMRKIDERINELGGNVLDLNA